MNNPEHEKEKPEPKVCWNCEGKVIRHSDCCGSEIVEKVDGIVLRIPICNDCGNQCQIVIEKCETCNGEGEIPFDEEQAEEDNRDLLESIATGN